MRSGDKGRRRGVAAEAYKSDPKRRHRPSATKKFCSKKVLWFCGLLLFAFCLNAISLNWGLSGSITWQPDAIEGEITLNHIPLLFKQWQHRYPRGQYLINWIFYQPLVDHWSKSPVSVQGAGGKASSVIITPERAKLLAGISRGITAVMSLGTIIAVFVLTKYIFGDYLAGWLAGFSLSISCLFLFFSGIGHVDVPFIFWFSWACVFAVRAGIEHKWRDYIFAALCAGYAFCTKEGYGGYLPGLVIAYCAFRIASGYDQTKRYKDAVLAVLSFKAFAAILVFAGVFVAMNGFLNVGQEFSSRMEFWRNDEHFQSHTPQLVLLWQSLKGLYGGLGWPLLAVVTAGIVYFAFRNRVSLVFVLAPVATFYLLIVARTHFTASRFFVPAYVCFAVVIGKTAADWIRFNRAPRFLRYTVTAIVGVLTLLYCIGLKLEMRYDTRNRAEAWVSGHVEKDTLIGIGMKRWYAPRLKFNGYKVIEGWHSEGVRTTRGDIKIFPNILIMSQEFPCSSNYKDDSVFKKKLYSGKGGYKQVAEFEAMFLPPVRSIFSIAGGSARVAYWVSPTVDIFQKEDASIDQEEPGIGKP